jgi:hypothetical protein
VGGGASLVVGWLTPSSPWRFAIFGLAAVLFMAGVVVIAFGFRQPIPPPLPPHPGIQAGSGSIIMGNIVSGSAGSGIHVGEGAMPSVPPTKAPNLIGWCELGAGCSGRPHDSPRTTTRLARKS